MKHLIRRFSRVADSSSSSTPRRMTKRRSGSSRSVVPSGHVPVHVGVEMRRFAVSADLVNHTIFAKLLERSAQEYGYQQKGVLHIPCHVSDFERVVSALLPGGCGVSVDVLRLIHSISPPSAGDFFL